MSFRAASPSDLPALIEIQAAWPLLPQWTAEGFKREIDNAPRSYLAVLEEDTCVLGFAGLWMIPPEAQITTIAVAPAETRRGHGRSLLGHLIAKAMSRGARSVTLEVAATNVAALGLYESEGFRIVGRRPKLYNGAVDAVLMEFSCPRR